MTNYERWLYYMKDAVSPDSFITLGFYAMIAAALQRRVYLGSEDDRLHGNMYNIMVGPAACGKGEVLKQVEKVINHEKLLKIKGKALEDRHEIMESMQDTSAGTYKSKVGFERLKNMRIPLGANATTVESLIQTMNECTFPVWTTNGDGKRKPTLQCSVYFQLEEMASLFRKHHENIPSFLNEGYDCRPHYEYRT